ncbi:MAG TPA: fluoride efflux transporter CrcB [Polyangia bacterium]|jgi:CrcB protein|nr:fluoride efflux transporter CrcB [Polyangia bacterium]
MTLFLLVVLGGAAGTAARFLLGVSVQGVFGPTFPVGTLAVNLIGSFLVSMFMYLGADKGLISTQTRVVLCTGVIGGFTTYSSFNFETMRLAQAGAFGLALVNLGATVIGCFVAGALGLLTGRLIGGA